jgi:putative peptidoglycan lipid II flippase
MIERILTVGGFTLLSRITGFIRDIMLAAILGAGPVADAFFVALRLPNHFRAIFAEGAFNAAFVPAYARILAQGGAHRAGLFADRIFTLLLASQVVLLAVALLFTPTVIDVLAPGFAQDPARYGLAVELTRITFPYLLLITLVTLYGGILNALERFAAASAAPIFLNLAMMMTLALAAWFPTAGHAAAWGVMISGVLQVGLVGGELAWRGQLPKLHALKWDADVKQFFKALGPATVGSAGVQLALFADTIIASLLPAGAVSALYYADRINQLPIGVIGIAAGTVILPEMSRRLAAGDIAGATHAQNRAAEFTLLLSVPCIAAFFVIPDLIMRGLFQRGAFTAQDAAAAGATLMAYAVGLIPLRAHPQRRRHFLRARRHSDAGEGRADRGRGQYRFQDRAHGAAGAGRSGARHRDRRLDQPRPGYVVCAPRRSFAHRCAAAHVGRQVCRRWTCACRRRETRATAGATADGVMARSARSRGACHPHLRRRRGLWYRGRRLVRSRLGQIAASTPQQIALAGNTAA